MEPDRIVMNVAGKNLNRRPTIAESNGSLDVVLSSLAETESLGRAIGVAATGGDVLALIGELGTGKTSLVRGIAAGLGIAPASVSSPTFVLIHEYPGRHPLIHVDLYRLRSNAESESIGLSDYFTDHTVTAIEWADRFPSHLPVDRMEVRLSHRTRTTRKAQLASYGPRSLTLLARIQQGWKPARRSAASAQGKPGSRRKALKR